ncbi:unnamed protein product [Dicrocoelium dendriticum]|nr:unnamed protein product [Dicrocoelium dendriticum]
MLVETVVCVFLISFAKVFGEPLYAYNIHIKGYVLKHGMNMSWNAEMKAKDNTEKSQIQEDVCQRLKTSLAVVTRTSHQAIKCKMGKCIGDPAGGYVVVVFKMDKFRNKRKRIGEVIKHLYRRFEKSTLENRMKLGPVVGKVHQREVITDDVGNTIIRFRMEIYENGQFIEWHNAYDKAAVLKTIESSICPRILRWGRKSWLITRKAPFNCKVIGPTQRNAVGYFDIHIIREAKSTANFTSALMVTNETAKGTYDLAIIRSRFRKRRAY